MRCSSTAGRVTVFTVALLAGACEPEKEAVPDDPVRVPKPRVEEPRARPPAWVAEPEDGQRHMAANNHTGLSEQAARHLAAYLYSRR